MTLSPTYIPKRTRRGFALLAALWLVVMIATAGLQFAQVARDRRHLGLISADRSREMAALDGALAMVLARLDADAARSANDRQGASRAFSRVVPLAVDPWRQVSDRFVLPLVVGADSVAVLTTDLGTVVNVNLASELELTTLIEAITGDAARARRTAQSILDWRDPDTLPRPLGAEAEQYASAGFPVRPANSAFRTLDDLHDVVSISPELLDQLRPYLTTDGAVRRINLNAAPDVVLRTLPGMTEPLLTAILALRTRNRRVESIPALLSAVRSAARTGNGSGSGERDALARALTDAVTLEVNDVAFRLTANPASTAQPLSLMAVIRRNADGTSTVTSRRWLP